MAHHRQVDLLQDHLILPGGSKLVLSPSCGETVVSFKLFIRLRKAHGVNVLLELEVLAGVQNSPVVGEVPWIELRVDVEGIDIPVLVGPRLGLVLGVPLPTPDLQLSRSILELGSTVGSGEDDPRGDEGATTLVQVDGLRLTSIAWIFTPRPFWFLCPHLGACLIWGGGGGGTKSGSRQQTSRKPGHLLSSGLRMPKPFLMSMRPPPSVMMVPLWHW